MLTLHDATEITKSILKWFAIGICSIILVIFLYRGGKALIHVLFPKPVSPPTVSFGTLPPVIFPQSSIQRKLSYQIDTVTGTLGAFPDRGKVYKTVEAVPNLLNLKNSRDNVKKVGFSNGETVITDTVYTWHNDVKFDKTISFNIVSNDFTISSNYFTYPEVSQADNLPAADQAKESVQDFLDTMGILPTDIDTSKTTATFLGIQNTSLIPASSYSTAQLVRVDLYQKDIDKLPVFYQDPPNSSMHFLIGSGVSSTNGQIVEAEYFHQSISNASATYPLKPVEQAFDELKKGKGYIASYPGSSDHVSIKKVVLGYYIGNEKQRYVVPIYVFIGKDGYYGYVVAVEQSWFKK